MKRVLAFGEVMMRLGVPDHKLLQQTSQLDYLFSGTGVNILSGLSHMGHETSMITVLPDNRIGDVATGKLREMGIGTGMIQYEGDHIGVYILETGYGARPSQVTYLNRSMSSFATYDYSNKVKDFDAMFKDVEMLHICGIALIHDNTYKMALKLIDEAKIRNVKVVFDCNYRASLWGNRDPQDVSKMYRSLFENADIVFASYRDFTLHAPDIVKDCDEEEAMFRVQEAFKIEYLCHTNRNLETQEIEGCLYVNQKKYTSDRYKLEILDRVGGGDGFALGILHGILGNYDSETCVEFGIGAAVLAHSTFGDPFVNDTKSVFNVINKNKFDLIR